MKSSLMNSQVVTPQHWDQVEDSSKVSRSHPGAIISIYSQHEKRKEKGSLNDLWVASCVLKIADTSEELVTF